MPKRVIDFDAMWGSDKLAACAAWAQAEYAWLYGLADASGCFELTNLRVIWGRVAAVRGTLTIERLEQVFAEFQDKGLLFVWEHEGKRYAHWTGSDVPGRLPPPSWRMRLERFAPPAPKQQLAQYMSRFARGRAALAGVGFRAEAVQNRSNREADCRFEISDLKEERGSKGRSQSAQGYEQQELFADHWEDRRIQKPRLEENEETLTRIGNSQLGERHVAVAVGGLDGISHQCCDAAGGSELKEGLEEGQAQDLDLNWDLKGKRGLEWEEGRVGRSDLRSSFRGGNVENKSAPTVFCNSNSKSNSRENGKSNSVADSTAPSSWAPDAKTIGVEGVGSPSRKLSQLDSPSQPRSSIGEGSRFSWRDKDLALARELRVGEGPVCGPARVRPEVLERIRRREAERRASRSP